jgi:hypothetical protein
MSALQDFNQRVIREFRANQGKVSGQLANMPVLLLTMTGARSGRTLTTPLVYTTDGDRLGVSASFAGAPSIPRGTTTYARTLRRRSKWVASAFGSWPP